MTVWQRQTQTTKIPIKETPPWNGWSNSDVDQDTYEPRHEISNNVVCATSKGSDQPAPTRSLIRALACRLNIL